MKVIIIVAVICLSVITAEVTWDASCDRNEVDCSKITQTTPPEDKIHCHYQGQQIPIIGDCKNYLRCHSSNDEDAQHADCQGNRYFNYDHLGCREWDCGQNDNNNHHNHHNHQH